MDAESTPPDQQKVLVLHVQGDNPPSLARSVFTHPGLPRVIKTNQPRGREAVLALTLLAVRTRASAVRSRSGGGTDEPVRLEGARKPNRTPASSLFDGMEKRGTPWQQDIFGTREMLERCVEMGRRGETYFVSFNYDECAPRQIGIRWNDEDISNEPARLADLAEKLEAAWPREGSGGSGAGQPFLYTYRKVTSIKRIEGDGTMVAESYHEVLAHGSCSQFDHGVDVTAEELVTGTPVQPLEWDVRAVLGGDAHRLSDSLGGYVNGNELHYYVRVDPPLEPGDVFGYRRQCKVPNYFPLTRSEIARRAADPRFPARWKKAAPAGGFRYGTCFDVLYPIELLTLAIHFPVGFIPRTCDAFAVSYSPTGGAENPLAAETQRCHRPEQPSSGIDPEGCQFILKLALSMPRTMHTYVLVYEPDAE